MEYRRYAHAAHYQGGGGHDLETWDVVAAWTDPRPEGVPADASKDYGYLEPGTEVQHVVYRRRAPLSPGRCERCP